MQTCRFCGGKELIYLDSYKHKWKLCKSCRCSESKVKSRYPLDIIAPLARKYFRKRKWSQTEERLLRHEEIAGDSTRAWDYFLTPSHIEYSKAYAKEFHQDMISKYHLNIEGKDILEISGGGGDFIHYFLSQGARSVSLSEYNAEVVKQAKERLGIAAFFYDINRQKLGDAMAEGLGQEHKEERFDFIIMRGITMWNLDVAWFFKELFDHLKEGGIIIVDDNVITTLGTIMTVQFDEYVYLNMYSPEFLESIFSGVGLKLVHKEQKASKSMVDTWVDRYPLERHVRIYYDWLAVKKLQFSPEEFKRLEFNARDIRTWRFIVQKA